MLWYLGVALIGQSVGKVLGGQASLLSPRQNRGFRRSKRGLLNLMWEDVNARITCVSAHSNGSCRFYELLTGTESLAIQLPVLLEVINSSAPTRWSGVRAAAEWLNRLNWLPHWGRPPIVSHAHSRAKLDSPKASGKTGGKRILRPS